MTASSSASFPETILEPLEDPRVVLVFPSEISARFWLRRSLAAGGRRVVRADRFIDWGDFKKRYLRYDGGRRAVTRADRTVFAWRILEENSRHPFFRALVPPEHAGSPQAYLGTLVRSLPALARLPALSHRWPEAGAAKREDLMRLLRDYRRFLAERSLYEPSFQAPRLEAGDRRFRILFPEVIEDFLEQAPLLQDHPSVATVAVPPLPPAGQTLITAHDTLALELERVLDSVAFLLDRGTDPEEVVLSVADLAALEGPLGRRAELRGIPLVVHRSHPVTAFPTARLFQHVLAAQASRFSLGPLKDLLLNQALPWREPGLARGLVRLGLDHRLLRSPPAAGGDPWESALRRAQAIGNPRGLPLPELRSFYRRLRRYLAEICAAPSFHTLKERLTGFARALLDTSRWQPAELGAFQFALDKLDELQEASSEELPALRLWLDYLERELYLPRVREGGVPVYDYPVAEGIAPVHHFLVNASQEGTRRRLRPLPALNPQEEERLELREQDLGPTHLRLFLHSGRNVTIGYSRRGLSRSHLPPALFVTRGSVAEADREGDPVADADRAGAVRADRDRGQAGADPEAWERRAWATGESFPLVRLQREGFRHAEATALAPRGVDAAAAALRVLQPGLLRISPTALESFHGCPFAYLLETGLGIRPEEYAVTTADPREMGAIMHRVFEGFVRALQQSGSDRAVVLEPSRRGEYRQLMEETVRQVCDGWSRRNPLPFAPLWLELQERARALALGFLDAELDTMAGEGISDVELHLEAPHAGDPEVLLVGTIDRVSCREGRTTVVDYKKKEVPSARRILGPDASSFQMPFYLLLMEANGRPVERAAYYSIEKRKFSFVLGGGRAAALTPELRSDILARLRDRIQDMVGRLRAGDYSIGAPSAEACRRCAHGGICRQRYLLGDQSGGPLGTPARGAP